MGLEVTVLVHTDFFCLLKKPGEIIPEICIMADGLGNHMPHFMNGDEGDNLFIDDGLVVALALSEAEMYRLALIDTVAGVLGIGCGLFEAIGLGLEIASELLDLWLIWYRSLEMNL